MTNLGTEYLSTLSVVIDIISKNNLKKLLDAIKFNSFDDKMLALAMKYNEISYVLETMIEI